MITPKTEMCSDFELVRRLQKGDMCAFEQLYERHHDSVHSTCARLMGDVEEANDIAQEVFLQLFREIRNLQRDMDFATWLNQLLVNQVRAYFRKRSRLGEVHVENIELVSALQMGNPAKVEEWELLPELKVSNVEEIRAALHSEEIQKTYDCLVANAAPLPKLIGTLNVLLDEVDSAERPKSWADVYTSAKARGRDIDEVGLAWREALVAVMSGELNAEIREAVLSGIELLKLMPIGDSLFSFEENGRGEENGGNENASDLLSSLLEVVNLQPAMLADRTPDEQYLRAQFIDFSEYLKCRPLTLIAGSLSFIDQGIANGFKPDRTSLRTLLGLALIVPSTKRQGLIELVEDYLKSQDK